MASELAIAGVGLIGVALGSAATFVAALVQRKGSQAQADATYRAAVTTAQVQYAAAMETQNRQARRQTYVEFSAAATELRAVARTLRRECGRWWYGDGARPDTETLFAPLRALKDSYRTVELAGPVSVLEAAGLVMSQAEELVDIYERAEIPRLENQLWEGREDSDPARAQACTLAAESLAELRRVAAETPDHARTHVFEGMSTEVQSLAVTFCQAHEAAHLRFRALNDMFTDEQSTLVVNSAAFVDGNYTLRHRELQECFEEAAEDFVRIAREHLNDTQPSIGPA
ncbi:hypothetical protein [Streptomyces sp. SID5789]|uniref:hypothetical protein n=1 Tax=Streptomyces sp. SID5789 TaxID=2690310 RepID=UPI00136D77AF|nr:hypothetical protein [Streptomyces sp. SID5789]MZE68714.1 hypothetical protein [Streptomyces sp. SID5789]